MPCFFTILTSSSFPAAKDGVVIATDNKSRTPLIDEGSTQKIEMITDNIGFVYSGMGPDYRVLVRKARKKAAVYERTYHVSKPSESGVERTPPASTLHTVV
jgi:20S proteasome subunit alpha 2